MLSLAQLNHYYQIFLCQGVGMGIGAGLLYVPALAIQAHHFRQRRALAMGIVVTGASMGGVVFPIMLNQLFNERSVGFQWGVRASGFVVAAMLGVAILTMRENPAAVDRNKPKPDLRGIFTDWSFLMAIFS
jgi:MFS family permease